MNRLKQWFTNHRTVVLGLSSTGLILLFLLFVFDHIIMPIYTHRGEEEELPDVTEKTFDEAREILEANGFFIIKEGEKYDATYPESTVIFQNPSPFSRVKKGRRIYVTLSAGERMIQVPRVTKISERDAEFILTRAGLVLGEVFFEYHNYHLNGEVFAQSIDEGMEVVEGTAVDITVSMGRSPSRFVVPDVIGKSLVMAKRILRRSGLDVGYISHEVDENLIPDTVIRQSVEPGEDVHRGYRVDLIVSKLEEEV